ncbi:hypothetical protein BDB00DRAFT_796336 [Zychaea mexicana]|uniref:uncharacterized protein n=1 Tax=Zychaea mexicana TaxID=64656 RepID=UPI0022FDC2BE|nr:uncharacterized protein BDB00DRAFT_796336 [Zychaea mexicana]KAI9499325.1 hypothetical protein BDB00DRAFT_796336 [Zychaea mexicana]
MWFLYKLDENNEDTEDRILARPGIEYSVGRKGTSIIFNDKSVSRSHATFVIGQQNSRDAFNAHFRPEVRLKDQNSKYGTFLNTNPVVTETNLNDGDTIKFGSLNSALRLVWEPVVICIPSMSNADKSAVAKLVCQLGVLLTKEWNDTCSHLYMKRIEIVSKLFLCMTSAKRIISMGWLEAMASQDDARFAWPIEADHLPPIPKDINLTKKDFEPKPKRATLFAGLEFWIFDKYQFDRYTPVIQSAKGKSKPCSLKRLFNVEELCAEDRLIVTPPDENSESFKEIANALKKKHKRAIMGDEISDAIIACSRSKACNPIIPEGERIQFAEDNVEEEEEIVMLSDQPPTSPTERPAPTSAVMESASMGDFFDDLLGDPDPVYSPSIQQMPPSPSLQISGINDDEEISSTSPPPNINQQPSSIRSSVNVTEPEPEPVTRRRQRSSRQLPGQLPEFAFQDNGDASELEADLEGASTRQRRSRRELPGQLQRSAVDDGNEVPETAPARQGRSRRQLPGQRQRPATDGIDEVAEVEPEPDSPQQRRTRRQVPGQRNETAVEDSSNEIPQSATTTRRQQRSSRRQPRNNQNDEFPDIPGDNAPEHENINEEIPIIPGKKYTSILSASILCSPTQTSVRRRTQRDEGHANFKRFKKVRQRNPHNPMEFIPAALTQEDELQLRGMFRRKPFITVTLNSTAR